MTFNEWWAKYMETYGDLHNNDDEIEIAFLAALLTWNAAIKSGRV